MAKSVFHNVIGQFAARNLQYGPKSQLKANAHIFAALNLFISNKGFKESYKTYVNLQDLDVYFVLQHF